MHRKRLTVFAVLTAALVSLALGVALAPVEAAVYQAGFERLNSHICRCPVTTGDCVCEWGGPV